tara:strand:+ start:3666 stop:4304 length:639 start_codon:yes stop_codon:yes gene_type:complete
MLFRQFFDKTSSTYTYLIASGRGREALIIDPVKESTEAYLGLINQLDLKLVRAIDTHTHADHVTALGDLEHVSEGDRIDIDGIRLEAIYTPGHTDESFSFYWNQGDQKAVFTGDVLLIRGSGRTDFQGGDPRKSYDSIVNKLFRLPDDTLVYPAHDYKGMLSSSIYEEKHYNPRLAGKSEAEYARIMNNLNLPDPKLMDVAVPANLACGKQP